jgi:hypothetical protein
MTTSLFRRSIDLSSTEADQERKMMKPVSRERARRLLSLTHRASTLPPDASAHGPARSLAEVATRIYTQLSPRSRARMLGRMLEPVGSLALAVVAGGAFAKFIACSSRDPLVVSADEALRTTESQVYDLARYVQQRDPGFLAAVLAEARRWLRPGVPEAAYG